MLTLGFYLLLVAYFLPKTKLKKILGFTGCAITYLALFFVINSAIDDDFYYDIANFLRFLNPIYWILGWGSLINKFVFAIIRSVIQLVLGFFAIKTTGYGFIKDFLPQNIQDKIQKEVEEEAVRIANKKAGVSTGTQSEKIFAKNSEAEKSSEDTKKEGEGFMAKPGKGKKKISLFLYDENRKLMINNGTFDLGLSQLNLFLTAISFAVCGFLVAYACSDKNMFVGIIFAILGLFLGPIVWRIALHLAFPEIFLQITILNNTTYAEISRLNKRIEELEKVLGNKTSSENVGEASAKVTESAVVSEPSAENQLNEDC